VTGLRDIRARLPHRYPILLVDRVVEVVPGERISTLKAVTVNEPWYRELPEDTADAGFAYPTALLIESWCQSAALLAGWDLSAADTAGRVALFGGMTDLAVTGSVWPGDVVRHEVVLTRSLGDTWLFAGSATVDGAPRLTVGSVLTALRPAAVLAGAAPG
jgi:3-hydroxyacyl-[acyl-carrier-protein] dehydratase